MRFVIGTATALCAVVLTGSALPAAQVRRPVAEVAPVVETKVPKRGTPVRLVAHVRLPKGLHVQSNKPRDPDLIPTELTLMSPKGATLVDIVYPAPSDLMQPGAKVPLAVYPAEFDIVVRVKLAADVPAGMLTLPASLRYQACNDSVCFPPARATLSWTIAVPKA